MSKSILIVFGNIDFASDNSKAIVNEVTSCLVYKEDKMGLPMAISEYRMLYGKQNEQHIIPQYYEGEIEWK
jgi:hypothetical protein